ncbi:MAG: type 1 glutamine amidotransferase [Acidimicrobiia bacterium]|nr:type 1 glutamine amidotransferase [Acidimicrobiia bacterium]
MRTRSSLRRVLVVQHVEPEGPALLAGALTAAGCEIDVVRTDLGAEPPRDLSAHAGLVIMGGPMSAAGDTRGYPSRDAEVALVRDCLDRGTPVLGVCLGAQVVALAGGAAVYPGGAPEIGWGPVTIAAGAVDDPLLAGITGEMTVLHWHGDTFDLPAGATHLASTAAYPNQAFRLGAACWGLQFHVEVDAAAVARFVDAFGHEAGDAAAILSEAPAALARSARERALVLERFANLIT